MGFEASFEDWWADVQAFAEQNRLPTHYVEEEFILDGEFVPVHLSFEQDYSEEEIETMWKELQAEQEVISDEEMADMKKAAEAYAREVDERPEHLKSIEDVVLDSIMDEIAMEDLYQQIRDAEDDKQWDDPLM